MTMSSTMIDCIILYILLLMPIVNARITVFNKHGQVVDLFEDYEAPYGLEPIESLRGLIVLADPPDACMPIKESGLYINDTFARFVLINGTTTDECNGPVKAENAENADFDAAVIYGTSPLNKADKNLEIGIPVLFVHYEDGLKIKNYYIFTNRSSGNAHILRISANSQDIGYYIMLFAVVIGVCIIVMVLFMICLLVKCIQDRRRNQRHRLTSSQIRQLPTQKFKSGDNFVDCAICLEDYVEGDKLRTLPCSHAYHAKCIDPWLRNNRRNCPLCKRKIHTGDSGSDTSSDSEMASPTENTPLLTDSDNVVPPMIRPSWMNYGSRNRADFPFPSFTNRSRTNEDLSGRGDGACNDAVEIEDEPTVVVREGSVNDDGSVNNEICGISYNEI